MAQRQFRIGTRTSLLAWRQSEMMRDLIKIHHPQVNIDLQGIQTRGDQIQDRPLTELEGKDFFVAELDRALLAGETDLTVHSLKDLSTERPDKIYLAAIPPRYVPHDILIIAPEVFAAGHYPKTLSIGTGSPRRKSCVEKYLPALLPRDGAMPTVSCVPIRGNVETRLKRLYEPSQRFPKVDGVVLALAGLERLWAHPKTRAELTPLLLNARQMLLPLPLFPTAPGQAALAIECRADDRETIALLEKLHCPETARSVKQERELLSEMGGGCHLPLGATSFVHPRLGQLMWSSMPDARGEVVAEVSWKGRDDLPTLPPKRQVVDGVLAKAQKTTKSISPAQTLPEDAHIFVAHRRALSQELINDPQKRQFWVPGVDSWQKLAAKGVFVSGCADSLGWQRMAFLGQSTLLNWPQFSHWHVLTHDQALGWTDSEAQVHATYSFENKKDLEFVQELETATHVYWGSAAQWKSYYGHCPSHTHHACGPGKTADHLAAAGLTHYTVFPSRQAWQTWLA